MSRRAAVALVLAVILLLVAGAAVLGNGPLRATPQPSPFSDPFIGPDAVAAPTSEADLALPAPAPPPDTLAPSAAAETSDSPALQGELTVLAAASLLDPFTVLVDSFETDNPGVDVTLGLGPSSALAAQVGAGAPADVLATASSATMSTALDALRAAEVAGAVGTRAVVFARNTLAIAVPTANPGAVDTLADLDRADVTFAMCQEQVPCGAAARTVLAAAGVDAAPVTFESDVGGVLTKVRLGEVDAGLVYASDVRPTAFAVLDGTLSGIEIPAELNTTTAYPIVVVPGAPHRDLARAFVAHVLSDRGRQVLLDAGFLEP